MPTFQSIGVHPTVRSRLVTQSSVIAAASSSSSKSTSRAGAADRTRPETAPSSSSYSSVDTPLALLASHPESLRLLDPSTGQCHALTNDQVTNLRQEVATAIVSGTTREGRHVDRVRRALLRGTSSVEDSGESQPSSKRRRRPSPSNVENENPSNLKDSKDGDKVDGPARDEGTASAPHERRIVGTLTSLELIRYESLVRKQDQQGALSASLTTGCHSLDILLSFPAEYGGIMAQSNGGNGVPRGYVTQLYGPAASGKTQLALHVAAHRLEGIRSGEEKRSRTPSFPCWMLVPPARQVACAERIAALCGNDPVTMDQTYFHPVSDIYQVLAALESVEEMLSSSVASNSHASHGDSTDTTPFDAATGLAPSALIVFDAASTCCCFPDAKSDVAQRLLHQLAKFLKRIARQHLAAVLVTNGSIVVTTPTSTTNGPVLVGSGTKKRMLPALGRIWERAVDIQLQVELVAPPPNGSLTEIRRATLMRHPTKVATGMGSSQTAMFSIHPTLGIRDASSPAS